MAFPTTLPSYTITAGSETLNGASGGAGLSGLLNAFEVDVTALGTKVGTGSSTPAANTLFYGTGSGTSAWQGLTSAQLASILSDETGSGANVFANSPAIVTPTIASFANANHTHTNSAGGGAFSTGSIQSTVLTNPYKFSVYRNAAQNTGSAADAVVNFDTKTFDTGSNVDIVTNKGRFTAPIAGFYHFDTYIGCSSGTYLTASLYKNGVLLKNGDITTSSAGSTSGGVSGLVQLAANDYVEVFSQANTAKAINTGATNNYFDGFLVSAT